MTQVQHFILVDEPLGNLETLLSYIIKQLKPRLHITPVTPRLYKICQQSVKNLEIYSWNLETVPPGIEHLILVEFCNEKKKGD